MKYIVLGGAGDVGSRAVEDLVVTPGVERVTIADRNLDAARALAKRLAGSPASVGVEAVDADDAKRLVDVIRGHDVAVSALGPFHRFELALATASLDAGVDYASVCDEFQAAERVIDELDDRARAAGRTLITGLGTSPGLTNIIIRHFHETLQPLERVQVSVYQPLTAGGGEAVLRHMLFIMDGDIVVWRDGSRRLLRACSAHEDVEFPSFGRIRTWNMGHSEPATVPRFLGGIVECEFFMGYGRGARLFVDPARLGLLSGRARQNVAVRLVTGIERALSRLSPSAGPDPGAIRVDVWGKRNGKAVHELVCGTGIMRDATGLSLSLGAQMLAEKRGITRRGGVFAPEACIEPSLFVSELDKKGLRGYRDLAMTEPLVLGPADSAHATPP